MGYMLHHAIVVTSWNHDKISKAHALAEFFELKPSAMTPPATNNVVSFFVPPDGSKEGWKESDTGDNQRAEFKKYLRSLAYEDGSSAVDWVEISYSSDDEKARVIDSGYQEVE